MTFEDALRQERRGRIKLAHVYSVEDGMRVPAALEWPANDNGCRSRWAWVEWTRLLPQVVGLTREEMQAKLDAFGALFHQVRKGE